MKQQPMKLAALALLILLLPGLLGGSLSPATSPSISVGAPITTTLPATTAPSTTVQATTVTPTTVPPTTVLPTTVPPTTVPPTTVPPTTVPPTTVPPTTVPPTTVPPTTVPPTTVPPTTVPPTTVPPTTVPPTTVSSEPKLNAGKAFVYHCGSGEYSYVKGDLNGTTYPASITKLMSIYVGLMYLDPTQTVTVGNIVYTVSADSSKANLYPGDVLTVKDLMAAMLLPSGNDAAQVWAVEAGRAIAQDSTLSEAAAKTRFIEEMNRQVPLLGLTHSHFVSPDGYDADGHYSSMADMCKLAQLCLDHALIRSICAMPEYKITLPRCSTPLTWRNTNMLLRPDHPDYYRPNAIGLKTGNTGKAGSCVLTAFQTDDEIVIIGIFRSTNYLIRFEDALKLYDEFA